MYYFENLNLDVWAQNADGEAVLDDCKKEGAKADFLEIIKLGAKFRRQLFDDYSFYIGAKTKLEADFECAMKMIEIVSEGRENFFVIRAKTGDIAGFWYLYDIIFANSFDDVAHKTVKKPVVGTFAGCLKKDFWGKKAREIMKKILEEIFENQKFQKIKCETFSTNPYVERILKDFNFAREGVLRGETHAAGRLADIKIWGLLAEEFFDKGVKA